MGDTTDGSSSAAQSAHSEDKDKPQDPSPGFLGRLFDALSPSESEADDTPTEAKHVQVTSPGMLNLRRMRIEDVAVPKADIVAVPDNINGDDLVSIFRESGLTRLPVYSGTLDTPLGFVHLKDFALMHGFNGGAEGFEMANLMRPLLYVPASMPIGVLLTKMQADRIHMALVIDEYGGTDGLVTIEDLIEQVVGEIEDEHDIEEEQNWTAEKPGCYLALAKTPLDEFEAELGIDLTTHAEVDSEEVETLGGLVFMLSGRVPARGEMVRHPNGTEFEVVDADPRRIKRLRVYVPGSSSRT